MFGKVSTTIQDAMRNPQRCRVLRLFGVDFPLCRYEKEFGQLTGLRELYLQADTSIYDFPNYELPESIGLLQQLRTIHVLNFPLAVFPEWIMGLTKLNYLMLRGSDIVEVPEGIASLKSLRTLRIENCPLRELPVSLRKMSHLRELKLCDTRITNLDPIQFPNTLKRLDFSGTGVYDRNGLQFLHNALKATKVSPLPIQ